MFQKNRKAQILTALMFSALVSLGLWQIQRLAWKTDLLARVDAQMKSPAVDFPKSMDDPEAWEYRQVQLAGRFVPDQRYFLQPRTQEGRVGVHLLAPFHLQSGGTVFVNLGWVPQEGTQTAEVPAGVQTLTGVVQVPYQGMFTPDNDPAQGFWYWADVAALAQNAGVTDAAPVVVTLPPQEAGVYPAGFAVTAHIRNDHLQYAFFWFGMAFILVIVYTISQRKKGKDQHAGL